LEVFKHRHGARNVNSTLRAEFQEEKQNASCLSYFRQILLHCSNLGHWLLTDASFVCWVLWVWNMNMSKQKDHINTHTNYASWSPDTVTFRPKTCTTLSARHYWTAPSQTIQRELKVSISLDYRFIIGYFAYLTDS
jgi:hypothetical protein